jgi:hypothetical protein
MITLSASEIEQYTGKRRPTAQSKVLDALGVPHKRRPDGSLVVLRIHIHYETQEKEQQTPALRLS